MFIFLYFFKIHCDIDIIIMDLNRREQKQKIWILKLDVKKRQKLARVRNFLHEINGVSMYIKS